LGEILKDFILQKQSNIAILYIARGVEFRLSAGEKLLAGPLGHDDYRMLPREHPLAQDVEESFFAVKRERRLGNQGKIGVLAGQRGIAAINPASLPITFTNPMPLTAPFDSTWAQSITFSACSTAVTSPNERVQN